MDIYILEDTPPGKKCQRFSRKLKRKERKGRKKETKKMDGTQYNCTYIVLM
jgi:hypothetical protein